MPRRKNIAGVRFGKLLAIKSIQQESRRIIWELECDCGAKCFSEVANLTSGNKKSCGCIVRTAMGLSASGAGQSWRDMVRRCYDSKSHGFPTYGAVGVKVCEFLRASVFNLVSLLGQRPNGLTIDRIKNHHGYYCGSCAECMKNEWPLNVRWATRQTQARNRDFVHKILVNGEILTPPEIAEKYGIKYRTIKARMAQGLSGEDLIKPTQIAAKYAFRGTEKTIAEIQKITGISKNTLNSMAQRNSGDLLSFSHL